MQQLDLFATPVASPIIRPVDRDGGVIQGEPDETLILPHPRLAWPLARIDLHQHTDGTWMWGITRAGGGYRVGPKWGKFAATRDDALHWAVQELLDWHERFAKGAHGPESICINAAMFNRIRTWAEGLRP